MANTFKVITRDVAPATSGSPETLYTVQTGSTVVVLGLTLANVHTSQVTGTVQLVSTSPCLLYTSPSPRDGLLSRMPSSA